MNHPDLNSVLDELHKTASLDFSKARSAPPSIYHHPDLKRNGFV
jgi:hypothetical protein